MTSLKLPVTVRLPRCVTKYDLVTYFGVTTKVLWTTILTENLLDTWGFDIEDIKNKRTFGPTLTRRIYEHYRITNLDADFAEEIRESLRARGTS